MAYAASGGQKLEGNQSDDLTRLNSPLEDDIYQALIERNYRVERRVGFSKYRIDLAVKDEQQNEFLLGIECDGVTYIALRTHVRTFIEGSIHSIL